MSTSTIIVGRNYSTSVKPLVDADYDGSDGLINDYSSASFTRLSPSRLDLGPAKEVYERQPRGD
jgi:hypothetical protein